jgi:glycosyltransferase involved in cell wall biosynthesis
LLGVKRLKICLFIPSMSSGGAERVMLNIANGLSQYEGISVDLVLSEAKGQYLSHVSKAVNIVDMMNNRSIKSLPGLINYIKKSKPDILVSAITHANLIAILAKILSKSKVKLVATEHSMITYMTKDTNKRSALLLRNLVKLLYPYTDAIVAVSKTIEKDLIEKFSIRKNKIYKIYNPIVDNKITGLSLEKLDHPWFNNNEIPVILSAGRFTNSKDYPTLLKAFKILRQKTNAKLVILGEGELRKELEDLCDVLGITNDVYMPGFVENPYKYMSRSKVFVLSSIYEGFGNVIVEAMACGTEVISTNCIGGPKEILDNGKYGVLVPVGNVEVLSNEILKKLGRTDSELKSKSRNRADSFAIETIIQEYFNLLNSLYEKNN